MLRNASGWFCFVLLLGCVVGFSAGRWEASAQSVDNKSTRFLAGVMTYGQSTDAFMLFDSQTNRLVAYTISGNRKLELLAVREVSWDLKMVTWGKQEPEVKEVREAFEKADKERQEKLQQQDKK